MQCVSCGDREDAVYDYSYSAHFTATFCNEKCRQDFHEKMSPVTSAPLISFSHEHPQRAEGEEAKYGDTSPVCWNSQPQPLDDEKKKESFYDIIQRTGGFPVHCAHRGGGFEFGPENTMYVFRKSVFRYGVRLLELDLWLTKDKHLVIMHWPTIYETTGGLGRVSDYTLEEILFFDAAIHYPKLKGKGIKIPTLREFLDTFVPVKDLLFMFDFKDSESMEAALEFIRPYEIENRYMLGSVLKKSNKKLFLERDSPLVPVCTDILQSFAITLGHTTGLLDHFYHLTHDVFGFVLCKATLFIWSKSLVESVHTKGGKIVVSGYGKEFSKEEHLKNCIEYGVDFIMTDRPDILQPLLLSV